MIMIYDKNKTLFAELNYGKEYYQDYSLHSHETLCFSVLGSGCIDVKFHKEKEQALVPEMIVIFNINQVHKTSSKIKENYDYFTFYINAKICRKLFNNDFLKLENFIYDKVLANLLIKIFKDIVVNNTNRTEDLKNILKTIFDKYSLKENDTAVLHENLLLEKVEKYLILNINNQVSLDDITKEIGCTASYITRIFKKKHGLSPYAFLLNKRIGKAKNMLLLNHNISIANLSNEICFYDQSHFTKAFKKVFAISPKKYVQSKKLL